METERLTIRAWREQDAEEAFAIYGDPEVAQFLSGVPEESVQTQRESLVQIIRAYSALALGLGSFPLLTKTDGRIIGAVLLKPLPRNEHLEDWRRFRLDPSSLPAVHEIEVGWHLRRDAWGQGFATESARAALDYGFSTLGLKEIYAIYYAENIRSARVADRLRMRDLGLTDRFYGVEGRLRSIDDQLWKTLNFGKTGNSLSADNTEASL